MTPSDKGVWGSLCDRYAPGRTTSTFERVGDIDRERDREKERSSPSSDTDGWGLSLGNRESDLDRNREQGETSPPCTQDRVYSHQLSRNEPKIGWWFFGGDTERDRVTDKEIEMSSWVDQGGTYSQKRSSNECETQREGVGRRSMYNQEECAGSSEDISRHNLSSSQDKETPWVGHDGAYSQKRSSNERRATRVRQRESQEETWTPPPKATVSALTRSSPRTTTSNKKSVQVVETTVTMKRWFQDYRKIKNRNVKTMSSVFQKLEVYEDFTPMSTKPVKCTGREYDTYQLGLADWLTGTNLSVDEQMFTTTDGRERWLAFLSTKNGTQTSP